MKMAWLIAAFLVGCTNKEDTDTSDETDDVSDTNGEDTDSDSDIDTEVVEGVAPTVVLEMPEGPVAEHAVIRGVATDDDQTSDTLQVQLSSSIDGTLLTVSPQSDSTFTWEGNLSVGDHQIIAKVTDADGNVGTSSAPLEVVRLNHAPTCAIVAPLDGAQFAHGATIDFRVDAADSDGDTLRLLWESSVSGAIFSGAQFSYGLPDGNHVITVEADDLQGGTCTNSVTIHVGN